MKLRDKIIELPIADKRALPVIMQKTILCQRANNKKVLFKNSSVKAVQWASFRGKEMLQFHRMIIIKIKYLELQRIQLLEYQ